MYSKILPASTSQSRLPATLTLFGDSGTLPSLPSLSLYIYLRLYMRLASVTVPTRSRSPDRYDRYVWCYYIHHRYVSVKCLLSATDARLDRDGGAFTLLIEGCRTTALQLKKKYTSDPREEISLAMYDTPYYWKIGNNRGYLYSVGSVQPCIASPIVAATVLPDCH